MSKYSEDIDESGPEYAEENHVIEIIAVEQYDWNRAKLRSSLSWLLSKVYSSNVPRELQYTFYENSEGQLSLRPVVVNLLSSSELYCQACSKIFPDTHTQWKGHWSIIQVLSRKGIYISDIQDLTVTETVLVQTAPFRLQAHLALIDALMKAYTHEVASVDKVVKAVRAFTTCHASCKLPDSPEEALVFWINEICTVLGTEGLRQGRQEEVIEGEAGQKIRVLCKSVSCSQPYQVPLLNELLRDIGNGCSIAAVIAYYRQHLLDIKGLCLKRDIGIADSLHNLHLISHFCRVHFPWRNFHLSYEDLLYANEMMYANIMSFLADLFFIFEGPGSSLVENNDLKSLAKPAKALSSAGIRSSAKVIPSVAVSMATKRSFQRQSLEETASNLGMGRSPTATADSSHQPLLPRRGRRSIPQEERVVSSSPPIVKRMGRRTLSLCSPHDRDTVHKSVLAWQDGQSGNQEYAPRPHNGLLANVSIDSVNQSCNTRKSISVDLTDLDSQLAAIDSSLASHIDTENDMPDESCWTPPPQRKIDPSLRPVTVISMDSRLEPLMPVIQKPTKERETILSKAEERGDKVPRRRKVSSPPHLLETADLRDKVTAHKNSVVSLVSATSLSTVSCFAKEDDVHNSQSTRAAENLVITKNDEFVTELTSACGRWTENNVANCVEQSDHESRKIQQEYQTQELSPTSSHDLVGVDLNLSTERNRSAAVLPVDTSSSICEPHLDRAALSKSPGSTTSFAELKRLKEKLLYCLDKSDSAGGSISISPGANPKPAGDTQDQCPLPASEGAQVRTNGTDLGLSELQMLRIKLEQKRKEIERKKHRQEIQQNKMRQRLGKAAFMRVVSKHLDGSDEDELCDLPETRKGEYLPNSTQAQLQVRLGHQPQKVIAGRGHPQAQPYIQVALGAGSQSSITDWRSQSHLSKAASGEPSDFGSAAERPGHLDQTQQHFGSFSRAGIQQTIDNVRNKWFGTDVAADQRMAKMKENVPEDLPWVTSHRLDTGASTRAKQDQSQPPVSQFVPRSVTAPIPVPTREASLSPCPSSDEEYGSPLDKLNCSLSELQGEIMRLSLQHEQLKAIQSPTSVQAGSKHASANLSTPSFQMHGLLHQDQHAQNADQSHQQTKSSFSVLDSVTPLHDPHVIPEVNLSHFSFPDSESVLDKLTQQSVDSVPNDITITSRDGYFVSFGNQSIPKHSRQMLPEHDGKAADEPATIDISEVADTSSTSNTADELAATLANQAILVSLTSQMNGSVCDDSLSKVGFIIKDETAIVQENTIEDEMQKKRIKLIEMQRKRKEEQERKRIEKETETTRKLEEKQLKEDEQERRKAEEKARRELIFQQYLQKKQEEEETPVKSRSKKRDGSIGKQRPKSMFVKSKVASPGPGSQGPDSGSSSREDLTDRPHGTSRSAHGVMSIMMHSLHGCLPPSCHFRKAVSSSTLQGASNGTQGGSPHRRPPSPDLYLIKQRHRGSSQDSGSETGSGSNPGSDYAGPKLFVKPTSRSNRHIIVNAISHCCLAGSVNIDLKNKVLEEMSKCDANHFLILFRDTGCQYRGLFVFYPESEEAFKVHGVGPKHIINDVCEKFYKYNSGGKSFSEITSTKHLSVSIDAVVLHSSVWKPGKAAVKH